MLSGRNTKNVNWKVTEAHGQMRSWLSEHQMHDADHDTPGSQGSQRTYFPALKAPRPNSSDTEPGT